MNHKIKNPIIPGFYPDPTICRVGDDFYLANSSFELCPGIPIFHSKDLANWEQIGYALTPENGFHMEKGSMFGGLMAPTLRYHDGTFYLMNANFADKGNYIVTATDPAGPWSMPHWLDDIPGIDASLFFDDDGQCYVMGTGNVWDNGAGVMERGIWLARYDIEQFKMLSEPVTIFNSALRGGSSPESPHLYHIGEYYYLLIAEGGTEHYHAVMVARSKDIFAFYEGCPANPVMTHRQLGFKSPIINVGHADLVDLPDGSWYAVMLASRLIDEKYKNLGRETFICPVEWERGWPLFSPGTGRMEWEYQAPPSLPWTECEKEGSFDDFDRKSLSLYWNTWGTPYSDFYSVEDSRLHLKCIKQSLADELEPMHFEPTYWKDHYASAMLRRQRKINTTVSCQMNFLPRGQESAGLVILQAMNHQFHLERRIVDGKQMLCLLLYTAELQGLPYFPGFHSTTSSCVIAETEWNSKDIILQIEMIGEQYTVRYGADRDHLEMLCVTDGGLINPEKVGCMAGTMVGVYASGNGVHYDNVASFDWFEMK